MHVRSFIDVRLFDISTVHFRRRPLSTPVTLFAVCVIVVPAFHELPPAETSVRDILLQTFGSVSFQRFVVTMIDHLKQHFLTLPRVSGMCIDKIGRRLDGSIYSAGSKQPAILLHRVSKLRCVERYLDERRE